MNKNVLIVNFNTTLLTQCCIKSVNKHIPGCKIYVFDNSDKEPFVNIFDNVKVIDNTKGQIINFNEWLKKYPNKNSSGGRLNKWGSAKHCYSIQKFMDMIKEPFVLLDSDVLIKKDFSDLFDERYVYVSEVKKQPSSTINRVIPFICFINTKLCNENNIHYFNENRMHGLCKRDVYKNGDNYDTGSNFYLEAEKLEHREIKCDDYIVHFGSASWRHKGISIDKWLKSYNNLYMDLEDKKINEIDMYNNKIAEYKKELIRRGRNIKLDINIDKPVTIQDKIQWLKLYDTTPLKTRCADKIKVHDYCKEKLGKDICIPIYKTYNTTDEIKWEELPQQFVIKCNHGSGMNIIVKDKNKIDKSEIIRKLNKWIKTDFAFQNGCELQYHDIERKIFVEEYKEDSTQKDSLFDYKFWCFNGEVKTYTINNGFGHGDIIYYTMNHEVMNPYCVNINNKYVKPKNFGLMVEYAKKLSEDFKFVRVDFYEINDEVFLGELTFTPGSGFFKYKDEKYNKIFGDWLDLKIKPNIEKNKNVVYTCISGDYDILIEPEFVTEGYDYICFTDQPFTSNIWKIRPIPSELNGLTAVKKQRNIKINTHKYLSDYEFSVWVDANTRLTGNINEFVNKNCSKEQAVLYVGKHPNRDCIYKEGNACIGLKKDTKENIEKQLNAYRKEGFPEHYGLPQTCILLRYHNEESCKKLMETWLEQVRDYSHRDQLSFNYALWKNQETKIKYLDKSIFNCSVFKWEIKHKKPVFKKEVKKTIEDKQITSVAKEVKSVVFRKPDNIVIKPEEKRKSLADKIREIKINKNRKFGDRYSMNDY